jgi:hypothetical protein
MDRSVGHAGVTAAGVQRSRSGSCSSSGSA